MPMKSVNLFVIFLLTLGRFQVLWLHLESQDLLIKEKENNMTSLKQCTKTIYRNYLNNNKDNTYRIIVEDSIEYYCEEVYTKGTHVVVARMTSQERYDECESYGWKSSCWIIGE